MIKRLAVSFVLTAALAVGSGVGVAGASSHVHGFQQCMQDAHAAYRAALVSGGSKQDARNAYNDAQKRCRQNFAHPRGK